MINDLITTNNDCYFEDDSSIFIDDIDDNIHDNSHSNYYENSSLLYDNLLTEEDDNDNMTINGRTDTIITDTITTIHINDNIDNDNDNKIDNDNNINNNIFNIFNIKELKQIILKYNHNKISLIIDELSAKLPLTKQIIYHIIIDIINNMNYKQEKLIFMTILYNKQRKK